MDISKPSWMSLRDALPIRIGLAGSVVFHTVILTISSNVTLLALSQPKAEVFQPVILNHVRLVSKFVSCLSELGKVICYVCFTWNN